MINETDAFILADLQLPAGFSTARQETFRLAI
jgi:hypothetical protein